MLRGFSGGATICKLTGFGCSWIGCRCFVWVFCRSDVFLVVFDVLVVVLVVVLFLLVFFCCFCSCFVVVFVVAAVAHLTLAFVFVVFVFASLCLYGFRYPPNAIFLQFQRVLPHLLSQTPFLQNPSFC